MQTEKITKYFPKSSEVNVCVPFCSPTFLTLLDEATILDRRIDVIEWRMDYYQGTDLSDWIAAMEMLRAKCRDYCIIATWRTKKEGGQRDISEKDYEMIVTAIIETGLPNLIDIEMFMGEEIVKRLVALAKEHNIGVLISNHDMEQTPSKEAMMTRLHAMQRMGADVVKLAVMPNKPMDVWDLMSVTSAYVEETDAVPCITMSMGLLGTVSRICSEISGSVMTFAAFNISSAPGQLSLFDLCDCLEVLRKAYTPKKHSLPKR